MTDEGTPAVGIDATPELTNCAVEDLSRTKGLATRCEIEQKSAPTVGRSRYSGSLTTLREMCNEFSLVQLTLDLRYCDACRVTSRLQAQQPPVSFRKDLAPILQENCLACHGPKKAEGGYRVDSFETGDEGRVIRARLRFRLASWRRVKRFAASRRPTPTTACRSKPIRCRPTRSSCSNAGCRKVPSSTDRVRKRIW